MKTVLYGVIAIVLTISPAFAMAKAVHNDRLSLRLAYCQPIVGPIVDRVQNDITWEDEGHSDASLKFQRYHECLTKVGL